MAFLFNSLYKRVRSKMYLMSLISKGASMTGPIRCSSGFFNGNASGMILAGPIWLENYVRINIGVNDNKHGIVQIGKWFYMNSFSIIDCCNQITIGERVQIGPHCYISDFDHSLKVDLTASNHRGNKSTGPVVIGDNAWIGAGVIILKSVTIGENAVIGAGSVITKNVPANSVVVGSPQRIIKTIN